MPYLLAPSHEPGLQMRESDVIKKTPVDHIILAYKTEVINVKAKIWPIHPDPERENSRKELPLMLLRILRSFWF